MLFERRGNGEAQCVHNATVVRSHSAVLVAVEIEWARRLSGGRKLRSPREILGNKRVVMVLLYYYYAGWVDTAVLSIAARGNGGDLVGEEEEEGCVMRQKDGLREALHKDRDADHGMARSRDSTLGRRGRRYSSSVQSRLDGSACMMIEPPQEPWTKITSQIACLRRPVYVRLAYTAYAASCRPHRRPDMWPVVACMRVAPSQCRVCVVQDCCTGTACLVQGAILRTKTAATSSTQRSWPPHSQSPTCRGFLLCAYWR